MSGITLPPVDAVALRQPLAPWRFPNGTVCDVRVVDGYVQRLIREAQAAGTEEQYMAVYTLLVPTATDAEWESMTEEDYTNLLLHAGRKLAVVQEIVEARRKNGDAGSAGAATKPATRRSSRTTMSSTSAAG